MSKLYSGWPVSNKSPQWISCNAIYGTDCIGLSCMKVMWNQADHKQTRVCISVEGSWEILIHIMIISKIKQTHFHLTQYAVKPVTVMCSELVLTSEWMPKHDLLAFVNKTYSFIPPLSWYHRVLEVNR